MELAKEVYDVINLQYRSGVKTYLEVINAESDLRTARINYYNALYVLLSSQDRCTKSIGTNQLLISNISAYVVYKDRIFYKCRLPVGYGFLWR